ncbi:hypothetical protein I302_104053 [Kwoniella bestiolae CBS 10118]|uniref:Uncharacterized protein n=1 Tax=Kwoniella bestiolae CBS 10118 TaxID=1296100 RepID=A0A1B9GA62_9TREE|nr:hypothetical protein I302_02758 [Kwoniella bestiolae CBS 10118]OCF27908.1 hypothetical protein I302_02758 [Kwoniella bestiolae CBS 10118]
MNDQAPSTSQHEISTRNQSQFQQYLNKTLQSTPDSTGIPENVESPDQDIFALDHRQRVSMTPIFPSFTSEECDELGPSVPILLTCQEIIGKVRGPTSGAFEMKDRGFVVKLRYEEGAGEDEDGINNIWQGRITTRPSDDPYRSLKSASKRCRAVTGIKQYLLDEPITSGARDQGDWACNLGLLHTTNSNLVRHRSILRLNARSINDLNTQGGDVLSDPEFIKHLDIAGEVCDVIPSNASITVDHLTASWKLGESKCEVNQTLLSEDPCTFVSDISIWKGDKPSSRSWSDSCTMLRDNATLQSVGWDEGSECAMSVLCSPPV